MSSLIWWSWKCFVRLCWWLRTDENVRFHHGGTPSQDVFRSLLYHCPQCFVRRVGGCINILALFHLRVGENSTYLIFWESNALLASFNIYKCAAYLKWGSAETGGPLWMHLSASSFCDVHQGYRVLTIPMFFSLASVANLAELLGWSRATDDLLESSLDYLRCETVWSYGEPVVVTEDHQPGNW